MSEPAVATELSPSAVSYRYWLAAVLLIAAAVRLLFFTGLALGDDMVYAPQSMVFALLKGWPPPPYHWFTRIGLTIPTAGAISAFGTSPFVFVLVPFAASLAAVWLSFLVALEVRDLKFAVTVGILHAFYPLEVIFATHLFPDLPVGVLCAGSTIAWWRAVRSGRVHLAVLSGAILGAAFMVRETAVLCGPVFLTLLLYYRPARWAKLAVSCLLPFLAVIGAEALLYAMTAGDPLYRWHAILSVNTAPHEMIFPPAGQHHTGGFWTNPAVMSVSSEDFGPYVVLAAAGVLVGARDERLRALSLWFVVGFLWNYYGTTTPWTWRPLAPEPRYSASLTTPIVILTASLLHRLSDRSRMIATAALVASGIICAGLDQGATIRAPHKVLAGLNYGGNLALEPVEFYADWWERGLGKPEPFFYTSDAGRDALVDLLTTLAPDRVTVLGSKPYFALSPGRRPQFFQQLLDAGWTIDRVIPGRPTRSRAFVGRWLRFLPTQRTRADRILNPPGLTVLLRPGGTGAPQSRLRSPGSPGIETARAAARP